MGDDLDLDALKALTGAASPGPWTATANRCVDDASGEHVVASVAARKLWPTPADAAFIAAARNAVPALIAELERLRGERAKPREWAVRHPGIGVLPYDSETDARTAAGTAGTVLHHRDNTWTPA